jgi:hypothetical protein
LVREHDADQTTQDDQRRREVSASEDVVELALAKAIEAEVDERLPEWEARLALRRARPLRGVRVAVLAAS